MDGKGRWMDNIMIERLWCSLKYEASAAMPLRPEARFGKVSTAGLIFTIHDILIPVLTIKLRMRHIGKKLGSATLDRLSNWRPKHEGFPSYFRRRTVRTTGATSVFISALLTLVG
jgi:hypothetical protein